MNAQDPLKVTVRVDNANRQHVRATIFAGRGTLAYLGTLTMAVAEYQLIGAALTMGAEQTKGQLQVKHEDQVFKDFVDSTANH